MEARSLLLASNCGNCHAAKRFSKNDFYRLQHGLHDADVPTEGSGVQRRRPHRYFRHPPPVLVHCAHLHEAWGV